MAFRWRADDGPTLNAVILKGSGPLFLRNTIFCDFQGGGGWVPDPCPPSESAHDPNTIYALEYAEVGADG